MGSIENVTDLLNCYDVDRNALQTNTSIVGFGSEGEWILGLGNFFWFFGFVIIDQSNWQVGFLVVHEENCPFSQRWHQNPVLEQLDLFLPVSPGWLLVWVRHHYPALSVGKRA